jgi:hypothetical protein
MLATIELARAIRIACAPRTDARIELRAVMAARKVIARAIPFTTAA